jgi:hypothetical protein
MEHIVLSSCSSTRDEQERVVVSGITVLESTLCPPRPFEMVRVPPLSTVTEKLRRGPSEGAMALKLAEPPVADSVKSLARAHTATPATSGTIEHSTLAPVVTAVGEHVRSDAVGTAKVVSAKVPPRPSSKVRGPVTPEATYEKEKDCPSVGDSAPTTPPVPSSAILGYDDARAVTGEPVGPSGVMVHRSDEPCEIRDSEQLSCELVGTTVRVSSATPPAPSLIVTEPCTEALVAGTVYVNVNEPPKVAGDSAPTVPALAVTTMLLARANAATPSRRTTIVQSVDAEPGDGSWVAWQVSELELGVTVTVMGPNVAPFRLVTKDSC